MGMMRNALAAEAYDREYSNRELLSRISEYFRPYRTRLVVVIVAVTLLSLTGAASPILIARGVGTLDGPQGSSTKVALLLVLAILVVGVLQWGVNYVRRLQTSELMGDVVADMRSDAFRSVVNHDLSFFDQYQSGRVVSRITSDTEEFGRAAVLVTEVVSQLLLIFILLIVLLRVNVPLTIVLLLMAPLGLLVSAAFQKVARRTTRQSQRAVGEVNVAIQEAVTGIRVAKNFHQEQSIYDDFLDVNALSYEIQVRRGMVLSSVFPTLQLVIGIGTAVLLFLGGYGVSASIITAGSWFLFMNSVSEFWFPITNLSAFWSQFQSALSATERIFALQDAQPAIVQSGDEKVADLDGDIKFEHVDFRYSEKEQVLDDFSLHIAPGEAVALVGHTGAGKSSIAKLVTRYYEFQSGGLTIDGKDIRTLDLQSYRRRLGIVNQSPFLFSGSVADNIRYAAPELGDGEVEAIARRIGGGDWLETLPDGLQTDVGERGVRLSLGQRQLVVLARMLAQNPAILILDEATASVDPFTEAQIQEALRLLLRDRTSIVVAHRLSTVKAADRIVVLQKGRIIEEGSHDALLAAGGHYAELYGTYFRHQSLAYIESRGQDDGGRSGSVKTPGQVAESS
jgi:ATP-binding cassette subfamily B protein